MLKLSKHFIQNWHIRVGNDPDRAAVNDIIRKAVRVQKGKKAVTRFSFLKTLTIYWHVDLNLIITVDHFTRTVVSVYSKRNMPQGGKLTIGEAWDC